MRVGGERADGEYLAEHRAGAGERSGHEVVVPPEVDAVYEETEDDGKVAGALVSVVFILEGADECVREVRRGQLNSIHVRCVLPGRTKIAREMLGF